MDDAVEVLVGLVDDADFSVVELRWDDDDDDLVDETVFWVVLIRCDEVVDMTDLLVVVVVV